MACDCSDLEDKICTLSEELAAAEGCAGVITRDADGGSHDHSGKITMKQAALRTYMDLYKEKGCGKTSELFEFVHTACVRSVNCSGGSCNTPNRRTRRRYRR